MEELDLDPDRFIIVNPVWHVVDRRSIDNPDAKGIGVIQGATADGRPYTPFFTDADLAERFLRRLDDPNAMAFPFRQPRDWLAFLEFLAEVGHECTAPDPEPGRRLQLRTISSVIQAMREQLKRQEGS
jgi:hypothetical protein